jgi:putative ABC transport system permease protein
MLVIIPTTAMSGAITLLRTAERSSADERQANWGQADYRVLTPPALGPDDGTPRAERIDEQVEQLRAALPPGSRLLIEHQLRDRVRRDGRWNRLEISDLRLDDPTAQGMFGPVQGRLPRGDGDVVLSNQAAHALGVEIGDTLTPDRLDRELTVVGTVTVRSGIQVDPVVYTRDPLPPLPFANLLIDLPDGDDPTAVPNLHVPGWEMHPTAQVEGHRNDLAVFWSYITGGVGLIVLGTVITAAFAVGARRQLRSVGLLASSGASPATIRWFLVAQGAVAGAIGSVVGAAAGVGAVVLALRMLPGDVVVRAFDWPVERAVVRPLELLPIVVIGTLVSSVAAWFPARSAARVPTLQALAGRRPLSGVPAYLPVLGGLAVAAGCALLAGAMIAARSSDSEGVALVGIGGGLAVLMGAIAIAPWVISGLERASAGLPHSWRLAGRSLARNRVRSSAVVAAICAVTASLVAGAALDLSLNDRSGPLPRLREDQIALVRDGSSVDGRVSPEPPSADLVRRIQAIAPAAAPVRVTWLGASTTATAPDGSPLEPHTVFLPPQEDDTDLGDDYAWSRPPGIASAELLDLLEVPDELRRALEDGEAVGLTAPPYGSRSIKVFAAPLGGFANGRPPAGGAAVPLRWFESPAASTLLPEVLISPATAEELGFAVRPERDLLLVARSPLTDRQRERLLLLGSDLQWERSRAFEALAETDPTGRLDPEFLLQIPQEPSLLSPTRIRAGVLVAALLLVLAVVALGLALAARDTEDESQVLVAVGAPPRTLRRTAALRAVLLVLVAGVISVPAGLLPAAAVIATTEEYGRRTAFRPDLWTVLFALVVVPAIVGLVTWSGSRLREAFRPTRPATFAFGD